jgi:PAS domain S-box-containing protein
MASKSSDKASSTSADIGPLRDQIQDLYTAVEKTLRQNIFDNTGRMGSMRLVPATSRQIVDTCLSALAGDTQKSEVDDHLVELTRHGLGPQAALAVADSLYWNSLELLEATPAILSALRPAIEAYRQQFLCQYMAARADQIITTREDAYQNISAALEKQITLEQHLRFDLERQQEQLAKRAIELEAVAQVSAAVTTILEVDRLLQEVADLTKERFALYHTHIYLLNQREDTLDLAAGAGEVGRQMKAQGWQIPLKQKHSLVARAARSRQGVVVNDVRQAPDFLQNPLLPDTRSELAVPLVAGDQLLGVLDVQADEVNYFTDEDVRIQTTLAAQVAVALQNAARYEETQQALTEQRRLLAETQQSQQLLRTIIDATPDWIFIKDQEHRYHLVNQGYANSLHMAPEEFVGKNDLELGFPEDIVKGNPAKGIQGFWPDDRQVMDSGEIKVIEVEPAVVDDKQLYLNTIKVPLRDDDGNVWGVLGFVRDITERERLLAEVQRLAVIVENHPDFIGVGTLDGQALYVNPSGLKMMGLPPDHDVTTMNAYDFYPAADAEMLVKEGLPAALETGSWIAEANLLKVDGTTVPVEETLGINYDAEGEPYSFSITIRDITERKQAEEDLLKFKLGIERSSDAVFLTEVDGTIVYVNSAFEEIYGYSREEALGQTPRILKSGVIPQETYQQFWETLLAKEVVAGEFVNKTKDGRLLEIEGNNNPILDEEGNLVGFLSIHRDITERKEADAERERLLAEVEATYRQYIQREWTQFLGEQQDDHWHLEHQQPGVPDESNGQILGVVQDEVRRKGESKIISGGNDNGHQVEPAIVTPISLRGQVIGTFSLQDIDPERQWTADELALVETVSEQLALTLENLRLFDQTQKRAGREQLTRQITDKMRASPDIEAIIQTGLKELAAALGVSRTYVKLSPKLEHDDIDE